MLKVVEEDGGSGQFYLQLMSGGRLGQVDIIMSLFRKGKFIQMRQVSN